MSPARRPYPEYRDSGIPWLGAIPAHWAVKRLKTMASVRLSNVDKKSEDGQIPVRLCNYTDVYYNERITADLDFMNATATGRQSREFHLQVGDVLITKDSESWNDIAVPSVVAEDMHGVLCGYHLAQLRPAPTLDGRFLSRQFSAVGLQDQFFVSANGITRFGLGRLAIGAALFPVPPLDEQRAISAFLDRETARLDALVERKERLIALLREKRSALITRAVTRGLDPSAPTKDSGVPWLGAIPAHWEVKRLRYVVDTEVTKQDIRGLDPHSTEVSFLPMESVGEYGGLDLDATKLLSEVVEGYTYFRDGDVIVAKITPCFENGKGALAAGLCNGVGFGTTELHVLRPTPVMDARFFLYLTFSHHFRHVGTATMYGAGGQKRIAADFIRNFRHPVPALDEQRGIAAFLDRETAWLDALTAKVSEAIERLREYRAALITAAVTGQMDVREGAPS